MKTKLFVLIYSLIFGSFLSIGQVRIKMQKEGGVYKIPCVVNGLRLKFIFDTGASNVSISLSEANLMLENGYLDKKDIIGTGKAQIADGSIVNNTKIILREIKINDLILKDVEAVVINELKAPLLLGQSAIEKLGKIQIEGDEMIVLNAKGNNYTQAEIDKMNREANSFLNDEMFAAAADIYQKLYDIQQLSDYEIIVLADCYYMTDNYSKSLKYFLEIQNKSIGDTKEDIINNKFHVILHIGKCYCSLSDYTQAEIYVQKSKLYLNSDYKKYVFASALVQIYAETKECSLMKDNIYLALQYQVRSLGFSSQDIWSGRVKNKDVAASLYIYAFNIIDCGNKKEGGGMMIISAKYGNKAAIEYCEAFNLDYKGVSFNN